MIPIIQIYIKLIIFQINHLCFSMKLQIYHPYGIKTPRGIIFYTNISSLRDSKRLS